MRFAEQGDLLEYVSKRGIVSEPQARVWFRQMSLGLQYLHDMDIAHRDLKCENALLTSNFNVKLADFGFARFVIDNTGKAISSETYCGSLSYAAPEVLHGTPYFPKTADIWSIGVILYVLLNKSMPFDDNNPRRLYEQQMCKQIFNLLITEACKCSINLLINKRTFFNHHYSNSKLYLFVIYV